MKVNTYNSNSIEIKHLTNADEKMAILISLVGEININIREEHFSSLVGSIVGQQLSSKAAETIRNRVLKLCKTITPESIANVKSEELRQCGVSNAKIKYIKDLAQKVMMGEVKFDNFDKMSNGEIIDTLIKVKGIGKWTAEMFLVFSLGRQDILSLGDVGLQRAIKWLYKLDELSADDMDKIGQKWEPYRSIASLYLWAAIDKRFVISNN